MTGQPGIPLLDGWDEIPGARGCTPQSCAFRDHHQELNDLGAQVFGLSTQNTEYQLAWIIHEESRKSRKESLKRNRIKLSKI
jgi:AhpC/TSA family